MMGSRQTAQELLSPLLQGLAPLFSALSSMQWQDLLLIALEQTFVCRKVQSGIILDAIWQLLESK